MIEKSLSSLSPLETFNKDAFIGDHEYSQDLCNFILAVSLIWNDTKNIMLFYEHIQSMKPKDKEFDDPKNMPVMPIWGEISGLEIYLERSLIAVIHELFSLIKNSKKLLNPNVLIQFSYNCIETVENLGKS